VGGVPDDEQDWIHVVSTAPPEIRAHQDDPHALEARVVGHLELIDVRDVEGHGPGREAGDHERVLLDHARRVPSLDPDGDGTELNVHVASPSNGLHVVARQHSELALASALTEWHRTHEELRVATTMNELEVISQDAFASIDAAVVLMIEAHDRHVVRSVFGSRRSRCHGEVVDPPLGRNESVSRWVVGSNPVVDAQLIDPVMPELQQAGTAPRRKNRCSEQDEHGATIRAHPSNPTARPIG
jgi:hypothetical protein